MSSSRALLQALSTPAIACERYGDAPCSLTFANDAAKVLDDLEGLLDVLDYDQAAQEVRWQGKTVLVDLLSCTSPPPECESARRPSYMSTRAKPDMARRESLKVSSIAFPDIPIGRLNASKVDVPLLSDNVDARDSIMPTDQGVEGNAGDQIERSVWQCLLEAIPACAIIVDEHGKSLYVSKTAAVAFRLEDQDRKWDDLTVLPERLEAVRDDGSPYQLDEYPIRRCLTRHEVVRGELVQYRGGANGKNYVRVTATPVFKAGTNEVIAITGVLEDVSEHVFRIEEQKQLVAENEANKRINALKDAFASQVSHELRTPLNGLLGIVELLSTSNDAERDSLLEQLDSIGHELASIVENLLTLQGLTSYRPEPVVTHNAVADLVRGAITAQSRYSARRPDAVITQIEPSVPRTIMCDDKLQVAIGNVLNNAFRYSSPDSVIRITVSTASLADLGLLSLTGSSDVRFLVIHIADEGEGIDGDNEAVFEAFRQGGPTVVRRHSGAGVGLTVARALLQAHGGDVRIKSTAKGSGTTMELYLPIVAPPASLQQPSRPRPESPLQTSVGPGPTAAAIAPLILAVDDEPVNLHIVRKVLERNGSYKVITAVHGQEAVEKFNPEVKLIVMDIMMPILDGLEATRRIRKLPGGADVPICAFTASAATDTHADAHLLGMKVVQKPCSPKALLHAVDMMLDRR